MQITLKPDAQKFVEAQVRSGRFRTADDLLEEAVQRMMIEAELEIDDETAAAINKAEAQIDRGEGIDFDKFAAEMRRNIAAS